jgi:hypothetical protein
MKVTKKSAARVQVTKDVKDACHIQDLYESLHWMLIQHTREYDGYYEANALGANFGAMFVLVKAGYWEWHPEAGEEAGRMCCAKPKKGWPE